MTSIQFDATLLPFLPYCSIFWKTSLNNKDCVNIYVNNHGHLIAMFGATVPLIRDKSLVPSESVLVNITFREQ